MKNLLPLVLLFTVPVLAQAQWNKDTTVRNPICTAAKAQYYPRACTDGNGGAFITWIDGRTPPTAIYAQHIDKNGAVKWAVNGLPVYAATDGISDGESSFIIPDKRGGFIIFYQVGVIGGGTHIFAQRVDASGNLKWGTGVAVAANYDSRFHMLDDAGEDGIDEDGAGGAFVTWQSYGSPAFIMAQHVDSSGNLKWGTGVGLPAVATGYRSTIASTGNGTAVVGYSSTYNLYMQRIAANGTFIWPGNGLLVTAAYSTAGEPGHLIKYDSTAANPGIFIAFLSQHINPFNGPDISMQKIDLAGNIIWQSGGVPVATSTDYETQPDMLVDKQGGTFITYDSANNVKVQHIDKTGKLLWGSTGITVDKTTGSNQLNPLIVDDGAGGFICGMHTSRTGYPDALFAQRYNAAGFAQWRANGIPVITNHSDVNHQVASLVPAGTGAAILSWHDERSLPDENIYATKVGGADGLLPITFTLFTATQNKHTVQLAWAMANDEQVSYYTVERHTGGTDFKELYKVSRYAKNNYTYGITDTTAMDGLNYYRIKETGNDGKIVYSKIVAVTLPGTIKATAYPNPVLNSLNIRLQAAAAHKTQLSIYNVAGKLVQQKNIQLTQGNNQLRIDVSTLAAGAYILRLNGENMQPFEFIKQ